MNQEFYISNRLKLASLLILSSTMLNAQSTSNSDGDLMLYSVITVSVILVLWALSSVASSLMKNEAAKYGIDPETTNMGITPGISDLFTAKRPSFTKEGSYKSFAKGYNIKLKGDAKLEVTQASVDRYGVRPADFRGMSPIPKVEVEVGQDVQAGDILFYDKKRPETKYVSPVSGEIIEINRGEKRSIANIIILADKKNSFKKFDVPSLDQCDRATLIAFMAESGLLACINERPFDVVPSIDSVPDNVFISTFDTAPLAPDSKMLIAGREIAFQKGIDVLAKLTKGKVHLGLDGRASSSSDNVFALMSNVEKHWFAGAHPAGNVGIHIHHTAPIKVNSKVWTLEVQDVATIGDMFLSHEYHADRVVALVGNEISNPSYIKTYKGASISDLLKNQKIGENARFIDGDVLSGKQCDIGGFISDKTDQVTVISEGNDFEMFGWLVPINPRPSISGTFPNFLYPNFKFEANTNMHGENRAFVETGQYESMLPMDIYPQHLMKAIMAQDIERMEGLGLTELSEEDVALCEFVCTSKTPVQSIVRKGLDMLEEQS